MNIRPIKTDAGHEQALEEIERLFGAEPNTPEGDRLEVLTTMVEAYEERRYPIPAPDPIEFILNHIDSRGLTRKDLERCIGSRTRVSEWIEGHGAVFLRVIGVELGHLRREVTDDALYDRQRHATCRGKPDDSLSRGSVARKERRPSRIGILRMTPVLRRRREIHPAIKSTSIQRSVQTTPSDMPV